MALPLPLLSPSSVVLFSPLPRVFIATVSVCDHMLRRWVWLTLRPVIQVFLVRADKGRVGEYTQGSHVWRRCSTRICTTSGGNVQELEWATS